MLRSARCASSSISISGLGHLSAMVVDDEAGVAVVVDPRRDVDLYLDAGVRARGLRIVAVLETHLHNDYVSGGARPRRPDRRDPPHRRRRRAGLRASRPRVTATSLEVGRAALRDPRHARPHPGARGVHGRPVIGRTAASAPRALFSGGSLLVGAVGRTDLLGEANAVPYAHAMYHSLHDADPPPGRRRRTSIRPTAPARSARRGSARCPRRRSVRSGVTTRCWRPWTSTRSPGRCWSASRRSRPTSRGCGR